MRSYESSHTWLSFHADLRKVDWRLWMKLGAIQSKCEHVARVMLAPDVAGDLLQVYLAKGVQATAAIEGNTLSEAEVLERVRGNRAPYPESKQYLAREVDNIIEACNQIQAQVIGGGPEDARVTVAKIRQYNRQILDGLEVEDHVIPGEIRTVAVGVGNYRGAPAEDCDYLLEKLCHWINEEIQPPTAEEQIAFGVLRAILAHLYIAWIHPFGDGNGRTARLIELQLLLSVGVPNIAAHLLSNFYNQTRSRYYRELDKTSKSRGDILPFLAYAVQGMFDGLNETIEKIREFQVSVMWRDYVYSKFRHRTGSAWDRKRRLALELWGHEKGVPLSELSRLTPALAAAYATKTPRTLARDIDDLLWMGLVEGVPDDKKPGTSRRFRVKSSALLAFYPVRRKIE